MISLLLIPSLMSPVAPVLPQNECLIWRMSTDATGTAGNGWCRKPSLSGDGDWIAFESGSSDLVPGDTNGLVDVFVRQVSTGLIERVSVGFGGIEANAECVHASISYGGRYVTFESEASNLDPGVGDTAGFRDVFRHDRVTGTTRYVSVTTSGGLPNSNSGTGGLWRGSDISGSGRFVVFSSSGTNVVTPDTNFSSDIFLRDMNLGTTTRVNVGAGGQANGNSQNPVISADATHVAYMSSANNLVPGITNGGTLDIYRVNLTTLTPVRVSLATDGSEPDLGCFEPDISDNGNAVAFQSFATTLVPGDTNGEADVFLRDVSAGTTERVSLTWDGQQIPSWSKAPSVSPDGMHVAFVSNSNAVIAGGSGIQGVYLRDRAAATTTRWSESATGAIGFAGSDTPHVGAGGLSVAFASLSVLEPNDVNNMNDIYLRRCGPTATLFCRGSAALCPCGNVGVGFAGCENSNATGGGHLNASGLASVQADTVSLTASGLPGSEPILFFQGTAAIAGGSGVPFGDGLRCVGGMVTRIGVKISSGGVATYGIGGDIPLSIKGGIALVGQTLLYQGWYRDPTPFCTADGFNLTNGVSIVWAP